MKNIIRKYREIRMDKKDKISVILPVFNGEKKIVLRVLFVNHMIIWKLS